MHVTFICEIHRFIPFPHKRPCMMMFRISNNLQLIKTRVTMACSQLPKAAL